MIHERQMVTPRRQTQPTRTSCGPTAIAILLDWDVKYVLANLTYARTPARRLRMKSDRMNVGEADRLLGMYGLQLGPRRRDPLPKAGLALIRRARPQGAGWHWLALVDGRVYDPIGKQGQHGWEYNGSGFTDARTSWYLVTDDSSWSD